MRKMKSKLVAFVLVLWGMMAFSAETMAQDIISLPAPSKNVDNGVLMRALQYRHSVRSYSAEVLSNQVLSDLLWAANGVNREDGRRTAPSAINAQDIELYVNMKGGVFHYDAAANRLTKVSDADIRPIFMGRNAFIMKAPVVILLVSNQGKFSRFKDAGLRFGCMDAGYVSQNIYLYCSAYGLGTVACAPPIDAAAVQKALNLSVDHIPLIYHPVGYPTK